MTPITSRTGLFCLPKEIPIAPALKPDLESLGALFRTCLYANGDFKAHVLSCDDGWIAERLFRYIQSHGDRAFRWLPTSVSSALLGDTLDASKPDAVTNFIKRSSCQNVLVRHAEYLDNDDLHGLVNRFTQLQQLSLVPDQREPLHITDAGWEALGKHAQDLKRLRLIGCRKITDGALATIAKKATALSELHLNWCVKVESMHALAKHCTSLVGLTLQLWNAPRGQDQDMESLCSRLTTLSLGDCRLNNTYLSGIAKSCGNLTALNLSNNMFLTDTDIGAVLKCTPYIEKLLLDNCFEITDATPALIACNCTLLNTLSLSGCHLLTDTGIHELARENTHLTRLNLNDDGKITAIGLAPLLTRCTVLRSLSLDGCNHAAAGFLSARTNGNTDLTRLSLKGVHITRPILERMTDSAPRLAMLNLSCCAGVTDIALPEFARHSTALTELDLGYCPVSEQGLVDVATHWQGLVTLKLIGCDRISQNALNAIRKKYTRLSKLVTMPGE